MTPAPPIAAEAVRARRLEELQVWLLRAREALVRGQGYERAGDGRAADRMLRWARRLLGRAQLLMRQLERLGGVPALPHAMVAEALAEIDRGLGAERGVYRVRALEVEPRRVRA